MTAADKEIITRCYRAIRDVSTRSTDPKETEALKAACVSLGIVLTPDSAESGKMLELVSSILGSKAGFVFIPFL